MLNRILSSKEKINTSNKRLCKVLSALILVLSLVLSLAGCSGADIADSINPSQNESTTVQTDKAGGSNSSNKNNSADKNDTLAAGTDSADWRATLPEYSDSPYVIVNNNEPFFTENEIKSAQPDQILLRNARKSENINRICLMGKVWGSVPYRAYYMSANLDHVLYDKLNSSDKDKENDAFLFAKRYKARLDEFLQFIADSEFSVVGDFKDSWEFIKEGKHSLERHTNLGICFKEIREERMANSCDSD